MVVGVLVEITNKNVDKIFDYLVPEEYQANIKIGIRVKVPFATRILEGFILEIKKETTHAKNLKEILGLLDEDVILNEELLELGKKMQEMTLSSLIYCYQSMLPKSLKAGGKNKASKKYEQVFFLKKEPDENLNDRQKELLKCFQDGPKRQKDLPNISLARIKLLVAKGYLEQQQQEVYRGSIQKGTKIKYPLTDAQQKVVDEIEKSSDAVFLLHGVTGSGKTEVYMELIENAIKKGKQSLMLVPEISLTPQMIERFSARFGTRIALLHSALSDGEKYDEWRRIERGEVDIVIGARSAIFAPLKSIAYIIIDEEHSDSYKQENNPRYDAKEIAKIRGQYHCAKVIMGSATPTLESYARAKKNVYHLLYLPNRVGGGTLPHVNIIDMNEEMKKVKGHFSKPLINALDRTLKKKEQAILLLNRRGYSSFVTCKNCGFVLKCPTCDITLTYHKSSHIVRCHYCGYGTTLPKVCPECHEEAIKDLGVGTEKIEEELKSYFPSARILRMDFDTTNKKGSHEKMISLFGNQQADILLGTQIVAKGLDFPNVTLVGVINADTSLNIPDFRSSEATFSLLSQVAGRSGRSIKKGEVYLQTYNPSHYAIRYAASNDYFSFYEQEMKNRYLMKYPPFYYLVNVKILSKDEKLCYQESLKVKNVLHKYLKETTILGPSPDSIYKVSNIYRYRIILKYKSEKMLNEILNRLILHYARTGKVKVEVDFNPVHL